MSLTVKEQLFILKNIDYTPLNAYCGLCYCIRRTMKSLDLLTDLTPQDLSETIPLFTFENSRPFHDEQEFKEVKKELEEQEISYTKNSLNPRRVYVTNYWWMGSEERQSEQRKAFIAWIIEELEKQLEDGPNN